MGVYFKYANWKSKHPEGIVRLRRNLVDLQISDKRYEMTAEE